MKGRTNVGGGTALNFKVVGGTTAPTNPQENTIWVYTSADITSWEFSAVQPSSPESGMVWFTTGTKSSVAFNALKKNTIQIYPVSAAQYIAGSWVNVTAKSYQGGAWVDWIYYLYYMGDTRDAITGGWVAVAKTAGSGTALAPTITNNADSISFSITRTNYYVGMVYMANKIDLTDFKKITFNAERNTANDRFCVWTSIGSTANANTVAYEVFQNGENSFDISSLAGEYFIGFMVASGTTGSTITMNEMRLDR